MRFGAKLEAQIDALKKRRIERQKIRAPLGTNWERYRRNFIASKDKQRSRDIAFVYAMELRPKWFLGSRRSDVMKAISRESKFYKVVPFMRFASINGRTID
jgi:hypothetical protein